MRSKASIDGHPIHPALIPFPFAFLAGGYVFDVAGRLLDRPAWWTTGFHLAVAGLVTALAAALPGLVDYFATVPSRSGARTRATQHMVLVLGAVVAFVVAVWLRGAAEVQPTLAALAAETLGTALLMAGGSLGGTLVTRDHISVEESRAADEPREESSDVMRARVAPPATSIDREPQPR
jgi:uncharacterized membrane protein